MTAGEEITDTMIKSFAYSFREAFKQIGRNRGMSIASVFSITAMLLILAVVLTISVNINFLTESVKEQFDSMEVFLLDSATTDQANKLQRELLKRPEVKTVTYVSKDQAMTEFKTRWGDSAYLLDGLTENPLPNSLRIELAELQYGSAIKSICESDTIVEDVRFYAEEVNKVIRITDLIQKGALVIVAFLIIVSVVVVSNTVKLTVMARQEEISIMKFVGATNWFIRGPLLSEGVVIGLISSIVSTLIASIVYYKVAGAFGSQVLTLFASGLVDPIFMITNFVWIFVALGVSIGAFGSILSMRRFLQV